MNEEGKSSCYKTVYAEKSALDAKYSLSSEAYCLCFGGKKLCVTVN